MPSRKKASERDAKEALSRSLREYSGEQQFSRQLSAFRDKVVVQAVTQSSSKNGPTSVAVGDRIPCDRDDAIEMVFVADLKDYLDEKKLKLRSKCVHDALGDELTREDDKRRKHIIGWPPYNIKACGAVKREPFLSFDPSILDPLKRFSIKRLTTPPPQLAFDQCRNNEGWLLGSAFEAMVASHAVWSQVCRACGEKTLEWCGGSDASWRDLFCSSCQSCYEIKSKADEAKIDKIIKYDDLNGGSYRNWCQEDFIDRGVHGSDFVVMVSRTPGLNGWAVKIAEIGAAFPTLCDMSFADAKEKAGVVTLKTRVTLKNPQHWFHVPADEQVDLDKLDKIFRRSFERVFPGQWSQLCGGVSEKVESTGEPSSNNEEAEPSTSIEDIWARLQHADLMGDGDDWEAMASEGDD